MSLGINVVDYILDSKIVDRYKTAPSISSSVDIECEKVKNIDDNPDIDSVYRVEMGLNVFDTTKAKEQTEDTLISLVKVSIQIVAKTEPDKNSDENIEIELLKQSYSIIFPMILNELKPLKINESVLPEDSEFLFLK